MTSGALYPDELRQESLARAQCKLSATGSANAQQVRPAGVKPNVKPTSLYIHVPFCLRRCSYCDFAVHATREPPIAEWLNAVEAELGLVAHGEGWTDPVELETVYVGGGTPSLMGAGTLADLRTRLERFAHLRAGFEWTVEANPETLTPELAHDWRAAGANRISLGAQTFHEPALRWMGRMHGSEGPARAVAAARDAGFDNLSLDLIFALPDRLGRDWRDDLDRALALSPEHISLYGLTAEAATPLGAWVREGRETLPDEDRYAEQYRMAVERLGSAGYGHYEVSNFALPGRESRHNIAYWVGTPYLGLGPGAHSFLSPRRWWNVRDWAAYRTEVSAGRRPLENSETLDDAAARLEAIWLGLRHDRGYPRAAMSSGQIELAKVWERQGWAVGERDAVRLTTDGWLLLDRLAVELDGA
jgi:oxygen-independent coproporphyrinogen-3 oxidase